MWPDSTRKVCNGVIVARYGRTATFAEMAHRGAVSKQFAMDLEVPGALPTMLCRPPTINGTALSVSNLGHVRSMPGITDVAIIPRSKTCPVEWPSGAGRSTNASMRWTR